MSTSSRYLGQFTEIPLVDVSGDAVVCLLHILADKSEGIGCSQQREELVLLCLVVQDLGLWFSVGKKYTGLSFQCLIKGCASLRFMRMW